LISPVEVTTYFCHQMAEQAPVLTTINFLKPEICLNGL